MKPSPLWSKGFRPFFLVAALHAIAFLPLWVAIWAGWLRLDTAWAGAYWHGHEMIFGFAIAVIAGFLLTAVGNWTRQETVIGGWLATLVALWVAGRVAVLASGYLPAALVATVDLAFLPALAVAIGRPLIATNNRRNLVFLVILGALELANLFMHLDILGIVQGAAPIALTAAVNLVVLVTIIIGGRVIPMFTRNALRDDTIRSLPQLDRAVIVGGFAVLLTMVFGAPDIVIALANGITGILVFARMLHWGSARTLGQPIVWVLHVGHAWIGVGLLMRAATAFGAQVMPTLGTHALTVGAIGTLTLGMMARVSLGHTGRTIVANRWMASAFVLLTLSVFSRAVLPFLAASWTWTAYLGGAVLWTAAFAAYLVVYTPILLTPRADEPV